MADIFLSYAEEDREIARVLVTLLEPVGWSIWWDRRIPAGKTWRSVLDSALANMKCMVVLWSERSVVSEWVIEEAEEGKSLGKLLPIIIGPVRPPRGFRAIQALDFVGWDQSTQAACFRTLLTDLEEMVGDRRVREKLDRRATPSTTGHQRSQPRADLGGDRSSTPDRLANPSESTDQRERTEVRPHEDPIANSALKIRQKIAIAIIVPVLGGFGMWFLLTRKDLTEETARTPSNSTAQVGNDTFAKEDFCTALKKIHAQAGNRFQALRGVTDKSGTSESKELLPGATSCGIIEKGFFYCRWDTKTLGDPEGESVLLMNSVKSCLPGGTSVDPRIYDVQHTWITVAGYKQSSAVELDILP